jgi:polysaccharide export outer membrane protein
VVRLGNAFWAFVVFFLILVFLTGCGTRDYLDPTQIGRFRSTPAVNVILDSLGVAEEEAPLYEIAEEVRPSDVIPVQQEHIFKVGDVIRVSIFELLREGMMASDYYLVSETGRISLPEIGQVQAAGFTEVQLKEEIERILSPGILKDPTVIVSLEVSQSRAFTILGEGVGSPSRYFIPRYDFRLSDALAVAGSVSQFNVSYIYVTRQITETDFFTEPALEALPVEVEPEIIEPEEPVAPRDLEEELLEVITPSAQFPARPDSMLISSAEMITSSELEETSRPEVFEQSDSTGSQQMHVLQQGQGPGGYGAGELTGSREPARIEWIYQDGRWIPVRIGEQPEPRKAPELERWLEERPPVTLPPEQGVPEEFGWEQIGTAGIQKRVIKIPVDKLLGGDPRYDIVIRGGDKIWVPVDIVGEFYVIGNSNRVGVLPLTGRPLTLMQAIAVAGGLGPLAWPEKVEVRRRIGKNREEIVLVNLRKIADGSQPDFFIKPNDTINVGSHQAARWIAVLRNAFRATYGFGFVYDRNFAAEDLGNDRFPGHISINRLMDKWFGK